MKKTTQTTTLSRATCATLALAFLGGATAQAGIKYWDNPEYRAFDVGDYAPGAVWNYDGIRNADADQPHSTTATTWKNLGSAGASNDIWVRYANQAGNGFANSSAPSSLGTVNGRNLGSWTENGFTFTGDSEWRSDGSINSGTSYTIQMLVNATISGQTKAKPFLMSVQQNNFAFYVDKAKSRLCWGVESSTAADHPFMTGNDLSYMTAILNGTDKTAAFFSGTVAPTSGDGFHQFTSVSGKSDNKYCICGYTGTDGFFVGTIHSYRYYKRVLSDEELTWNRVVDEARYFNRVAPLPVTNVVVATAVAGANGTEPAGCYAVDGLHTFTAPATVTVGGIDYVCTGYTVETRNGDGWSAPVFHKAAIFQPCAYRVTTDHCVRLTWQWAKAAGLANLGYDVSDYVWDGLEVFYDGICNQGTNVAHSYTATNWVNLGSVGSDNDMFIQRLKLDGKAWVDVPNLSTVGANDPGYWTENGFTMNGTSRFRCNAPGGFNVVTSYSLQMLVDAKASDQVNSNYAYLLGAQQDQFALRLHPTNGKLFFRYESGTNNSPFMAGGTYDYVTAIMRDTNKQTIFSGTTEPTSGDGYRADPACGYSDTGFAFGGYSKEGVNNRFVGTIKNFRQYGRALTSAEVAQNRKVDNWRFFGIPDNPNVIVQSTVPYLRGDEPDGPYAVEGSHVFTAPASVTANGIDYACDGYTVETWGALADKGDGWSAATHYAGNSYNYSTSAGKVRLTWKWKATRGLRKAADYGFEDYSQAGIVWHFDGKLNCGVNVARSTTATTWKNLAPNPVTPELFVQRINSARNNYDNTSALSSLAPAGDRDPGEWTDDGFLMKGHSRWRGLGQVGPVANWTLQTLVDADVNDIAEKLGYVVSVSWSSFAMVLRKKENIPNTFHFNVQGTSGSYDRPYIQNESGKYDYATAILDSSDCTAKMFQGVTPPTDGGIAGGYYKFSSITPFKDNNFGIGAATSYNEYFIGTLKSVRYYDRVLTEEEIVRNRNVDSVRYFGALGVTNVYVVAGGGEQAENGAYKVEGEWIFTAETIREKGVEKAVTGYCTEELVDGVWKHKTRHEGTTYTYVEGTSPATVRLTWAGQPAGFTIIIQ